MKLLSFLKTKLLFITFQIFIVIFIWTLFFVLNVGSFASIFIIGQIILFDVIVLTIEYIQKRNFYNNLNSLLESVDRKYLISEIIEEPDFLEGKLLTDLLKQASKSMNDEIAKHKIAEQEYRDYIETWIHEVKIPIACIGLICENNRNDITKSIIDETEKINTFAEQALYYARSTAVEKDYFIRKVNLDSLVKTVIRKYSKQLIQSKAEIKMDNLNIDVFSDSKWLNFILGQIISNSIKYKKDFLILSFGAEESDTQIVLSVSDNGIGIPAKDLPRVFEKGFTGEIGRRYAKSTGIGLYLCKKLCKKMHLGIKIHSQPGKGTTVYIIFPKDKTILLES